MEFCLHLLACNIHADLYNNVSFVGCAVGNLIREFVWHANQCVLGPLDSCFTVHKGVLPESNS